MNYLVINTAGQPIEILAFLGGQYSYFSGDRKEMASELLLKTIDSLLDNASFRLKDIDCFGCVVGPGSFTGIRIGLSTIRAFGSVLSRPIVSINQFELFAYNNKTPVEYVVCIADGSNGISYVTVLSGCGRQTVLSPRCIRNSQIDEFLSLIEEPFSVITDLDLPSVRCKILKPVHNGDDLKFIMETRINERAFLPYDQLQPMYIRRPQAEREEGEL